MNIFRKVMVQPWLAETGPLHEFDGKGSFDRPTAKVALFVLLFTLSILFLLLASAYFMRMNMASDWVVLNDPGLLWINTGLLIASSIAMQWAVRAGRAGDLDMARAAFFSGGLFAAAFLVGQYMAWQQLSGPMYFAASNPANAFFYLITGAHGVHMLGGLVAWTRGARNFLADEPEEEKIRLSIELCTIYWHFLLLVWAGLFYLLLST